MSPRTSGSNARFAAALMSGPAVEPLEIGGGGGSASLRSGTVAQDAIALQSDRRLRPTNWSGGLDGGITNGLPVVAKIALEQIATTLTASRPSLRQLRLGDLP